MNLIQTLVLSIVEGLTEFLPISSTGHLLLTSEILRISQTEFVKSFEVIIQLGAILAVVVFFSKQLTKNLKLWKPVLFAFIPTAVVGFLLYKVIKNIFFEQLWITIFMLFAGGLAIIVFEYFYRRKLVRNEKMEKLLEIKDLNWKSAGLIGIIQSLSVVPGTSRALVSIYGGMLTGLSREQAVEFSFLLAVPTIFAAAVLDMVQTSWQFSNSQWGSLGLGFFGAFVSALIVIKFFLQFAKKNNFIVFGVYRIILAALCVFFLF